VLFYDAAAQLWVAMKGTSLMRLRPWNSLILCLVFFPSLPANGQKIPNPPTCEASSDSPAQTLSGTVADPTGARIASATIRLECGERSLQARTDGAGRFTLNAPAGPYRLRFEATGFADYTRAVSLGQSNQSGQTTEVVLAIQNASNAVTVQAESGYVAQDSTLATKTDTPLLETPQSISVITRDEMDAQAPQSLNETLRYAPGIVAESEGPSSSFWGSSSLMLRGFVPDVYQDGLTDDAYGNTQLDSYFYQRAEVLEGPSSVLYGQGNPAGIVNVESKRPTVATLRELQLGFGTFGRYEGNFDFSGPLVSPHLLYRLTGVGFTEGTQTWFVHPQRVAIAPALTCSATLSGTCSHGFSSASRPCSFASSSQRSVDRAPAVSPTTHSHHREHSPINLALQYYVRVQLRAVRSH